MIYIYDVLLNFTNDYRIYEFFEWELNDNIVNVNKIPLIRTDSIMLNDIIFNKVKLGFSVLSKIVDKTEIYVNKRKEKVKYALLLTDGYKTLGLKLSNDGMVIRKSFMLLDEEEETLVLASKLICQKIEYTVIRKERLDFFITRNNIKKKKFLINELNNIYKNKDTEKMKYLYIEYFEESSDSIDDMYHRFISSMKIDLDDGHDKIYNLLKLSYQRK